MSSSSYPELAKFMGAWFHQDYDIDGGIVAEVVKAYSAVTPVVERRKLQQEIARFLTENEGDLNDVFQTTFEPDVMPEAISGSARTFLGEIDRALEL